MNPNQKIAFKEIKSLLSKKKLTHKDCDKFEEFIKEAEKGGI